MTSEKYDKTLNRRQLLQVAGATAGAGLLAGCSGATNQEYIADTVVLPSDAQERLNFAPIVEETQERQIERSIAGQDVNATIESSVAVYGSTDIEIDFSAQMANESGTNNTSGSGSIDTGELGGGTLSVGVLSTPAANVGGQSLNPLASVELGELLTNDQAASFLSSAGVGGSGDIQWERQPEQLFTTSATMLGSDITIETYGGVIGGSDPTAAYAHLGRTENENSVVISAGVQGMGVEDTTRPLVGEDGYFTEAELTDARSSVADVDAALVVR